MSWVLTKPFLRIYINGQMKYSLISSNNSYMCLLKKGDAVDLIHSSGDFEEFEVEKPDVYHFYLTKEGHIGFHQNGEFE